LADYESRICYNTNDYLVGTDKILSDDHKKLIFDRYLTIQEFRKLHLNARITKLEKLLKIIKAENKKIIEV
jgi:hypothetical protein